MKDDATSHYFYLLLWLQVYDVMDRNHISYRRNDCHIKWL